VPTRPTSEQKGGPIRPAVHRGISGQSPSRHPGSALSTVGSLHRDESDPQGLIRHAGSDLPTEGSPTLGTGRGPVPWQFGLRPNCAPGPGAASSTEGSPALRIGLGRCVGSLGAAQTALRVLDQLLPAMALRHCAPAFGRCVASFARGRTRVAYGGGPHRASATATATVPRS
jgi:hypothetical protein